MIKTLQIHNYALIEELSISPSAMLNIITGETGAGKSIMLGAVGLLLGNRADMKVLLDANRKCVVEGVFDVRDYKMELLFEREGLDYADDCVIRREINSLGKSRAFINDSPVTLAILRTIGARLMDVHSQYASLNLGSNDYQLEVLDTFAGHHELLRVYQEHYRWYRQKEKRYTSLVEQSRRASEDAEYKRFLLEELENAKLDDLAQEHLEKELKTLENAEEIKLRLSESSYLLDDSDSAVIEQLKEVKQSLSMVQSYSGGIKGLVDRLESVSIELQDVCHDLSAIQEGIEYDSERIGIIKERLDLLYRLQKKHSVQTTGALIALRDRLAVGLSKVASLDREIAQAEKELAIAEKHMQGAGTKLTESRKLFALNLSDEIEKIIKKIGIENGVVETMVHSISPHAKGLDRVEMLFSANKGIKPQELKEAASGGEFSRLMFAIKYLIADKTALPTIIFDEIETGVSGQVAIQMIRMMKKMARNHQVISISHLPQFAAGGDSHYYVYKDHSSVRSVSKMKLLAGKARVMEIAKMIGGENPAPSALASARELLQIG